MTFSRDSDALSMGVVTLLNLLLSSRFVEVYCLVGVQPIADAVVALGVLARCAAFATPQEVEVF